MTVSQLTNRLFWIPATLSYPFKKLVEDHLAKVKEAQTVDELVKVLYDHTGFLNPGLLCYIVDKLGDKEIQGSVHQYEAALRSFREKTKIGKFIEFAKAIGCSALYVELGLVVKLGEGWRERTLEDLEKFRCDLSRALSLNSYAMQVRILKQGCVAVVFGIPCSIDVGMIHLKAAELQDIFAKRNVSQMIFTEVSSRYVCKDDINAIKSSVYVFTTVVT